MHKVKIQSVSRDLVGNSALVRADIMENLGRFSRVVDAIEIEIEGGARMSLEELTATVLEEYQNA